jgi:hypothetical protein
MRCVYLAVIVLFLAAIILFAVQSFEIVTVAAIYVIGMAACWRYLAARSEDQGARLSF